MDATRTTHVKQYRSCQLAWRLTAVEKVPQPAKKNLEIGTLVHRELELWWLHGTEPQRPMARAAVPVLEAFFKEIGIERGHHGRAEWSFSTDVGGIRYGGQSDLVLFAGDDVWVVDYKTSVDIDKYGLTGWQLANDLQLGVYASRVLDELAPGALGAHVAHVQIATVDAWGRPHDDPDFVPRVEMERAYMTRVHAMGIWNSAVDTVRQMAQTSTLPLTDVPGTTEHCGAYGGCAYRTRCHAYAAAKGRKATTTTTEDTMYQTTDTAPTPSYTYVSPSRLWVLIDTTPEIGGADLPQPIQHLDYILAPFQQQVAAENRVPLYSMVQFGQGPKQVIAKLAQAAPLTGTVLVDSMTPCANDAIEYLRPKASLVLRRAR